MNSSTSSSNLRFLGGGLLAGLFLGIMFLGGLTKNHIAGASQIPVELRSISRSFWVRKTFAAKKYDIIIAGDSRAYCGIVPSIIGEGKSGVQVLNLGYPLAGWTEEYCRLIEGKLSQDGLRIIILGLSPHSFIPSAQANASLRRYLDTPMLEAWMTTRLPKVEAWFQPIKMTDIPFWLLGKGPFSPEQDETHLELQIPYEDGWIASWSASPSVEGNVNFYRRIFKSEQISKQILGFLCAKISDWRRQGIQVFCVRVPASPEVEEVENSFSGFDNSTVPAALTAAGGVWIDVPDRKTYRSYDGSHLFREDAQRLSTYVAKAIKSTLVTNVQDSL